MGRSTTRIQNLTKVTTLEDNDVFPIGPTSGDRAKGITFSDLDGIITSGFVNPVIVEVSGDYTITTDDDFVSVVGPAAVTLPLAAVAFKAVSIKSRFGGGTLTLTATGTDTIDGAGTQPIVINAALTIFPVSAGWVII